MQYHPEYLHRLVIAVLLEILSTQVTWSTAEQEQGGASSGNEESAGECENNLILVTKWTIQF